MGDLRLILLSTLAFGLGCGGSSGTSIDAGGNNSGDASLGEPDAGLTGCELEAKARLEEMSTCFDIQTFTEQDFFDLADTPTSDGACSLCHSNGENGVFLGEAGATFLASRRFPYVTAFVNFTCNSPDEFAGLYLSDKFETASAITGHPSYDSDLFAGASAVAGPGFNYYNNKGRGCFECDAVAQNCPDLGDECMVIDLRRVECFTRNGIGNGLEQGAPCDEDFNDPCSANSCEFGYGPHLPATPSAEPVGTNCAFYCSPSVEHIGGDPSAVPCDFTSGDRADGPGAGFECRFLQTWVAGSLSLPTTIGICVDPAVWGSCADDDNLPGCRPL